MKNLKLWKPSKYVYVKGELIASRNQAEVMISSRLVVDLIARCYDKNIRKYCRGKLVDLGCGKVPLFMVYKKYITSNTCVDWSSTVHGNLFHDHVCDLTKKLPLKSNEYNTIILSDVLEHIPEPKLLFREMNRILKKDGIILLSTPFYYWLHEAPHDYFRYTKYSLMKLSQESGFHIVLIHEYGGVPEILGDILAKNLVNISLVGRMLANTVQSLLKFFVTKTTLGAKISSNTSKHFPLGYFVILKKI